MLRRICFRSMGIVLTLLWSGHLWAIGFSSGDHFVSTYVYGDLNLTCMENGFYERARVQCQDNILSPAEFDYFVYDGSLEASLIREVELSSVVGGRRYKQTQRYDSEKNRSSKRFNLWFWTLTQKPLLQIGDNKISYVIKDSNGQKHEGEFDVKVEAAPERQCAPRHMTSRWLQDCRGGAARMCDRYFSDQNYCF